MKKHWKLFKKEFILQKKTIPFVMILVLALLFSNTTPQIDGLMMNSNFIASVFIISTMIVTTSMIHDDKNQVMMMLIGLPIKRKQLVVNKYLFTNLVTILCSIAMTIIFWIVDILLGDNSFISPVYLSDTFFSIAMVNFYFLGIFPLFFKYGYTKTQIYNMVLIIILMGITFFLFHHMPKESQSTTHNIQGEISCTTLGIILMIASYVASYISYQISVVLFKTREF
jgi:ABC-2 type transport system permease protein